MSRFNGLLVVFVALAALVSASSLTLLPESAYTEACICDTAQVNFAATNTGTAADSFTFSITGDQPWGIVAPGSAVIEPGQTLPVYSFLTPTCFSSVGVYDFTVKAQSSDSTKQSQMTLSIHPCISITDLEPSKSMCFGEAKSYPLLLKNDSRTADKNYTLFVTGNGAAAVTVPTIVFVPSEGAATIQMQIDSTKLAVGDFSVQIRAVSIYALTGQPTEDEDTITLSFELEDCQSLSLDFPTLENEQVDKCVEREESFPMVVTNNGALSDEVWLSASSTKVSLETSHLVLDPGESEEVTVTLDESVGNTSFTMVAQSGLGASASTVLSVESGPCYGVRITPQFPERICTDRVSKHPIVIKNLGDEAWFNLSLQNVSFMYLNQTRVHLNAGEEKTVYLVVTPGIKDGNYTPRIWAESVYSEGEASQEFELVRCYDVEVLTENDFVCQCQDKTFVVEVVNTGFLTDDFRIGLSSAPEWLEFDNVSFTTIPGKSRKTLLPHVFTCDAAPGEYAVVFNVLSLSQNSTDKVCLNITVNSKAECYTARIDLSQGEFVECKSTLITVNVTNEGLLRNTFALSVDAPKWVSIQPDFLTLEPKEKGQVFLVVSPPLNEAGNEYDVTVKALSTGLSSTATMKLKVVGAGEGSVHAEALQASVDYANGSLFVHSLEGALVDFYSPSNESYSMLTDANGIALLETAEYGIWTITVLKEGFEPAIIEYALETEAAPEANGFASSVVYLLILAAFLVFGAFAYKQFYEGKK